jgi:hypothetical protein
MPDEDAQLRANESAPEVERAVRIARVRREAAPADPDCPYLRKGEVVKSVARTKKQPCLSGCHPKSPPKELG